MSIAKLTGENGSLIELEAVSFLRIRSAVDSERKLHAATMRIDYPFTVYVKEAPEAVAEQATTTGGLTTLGKLILQNAWPLWFNGKQSVGPFPIPATWKKDGVFSALKIGGQPQRVGSSPQEVYDAIKATGGTMLPVPPDLTLSRKDSNKIDLWPELDGAWDSEVPEFQFPSTTS